MIGRLDHWSFHRDDRHEWRWTRYSPDGGVVGRSSEGYHALADCQANAHRLGWRRRAWPITRRPDRWSVYRDQAGRWRWRRQARNHRIVGAAHRGFASRADCEANARRFGWSPPAPCARTATDDWRRCC